MNVSSIVVQTAPAFLNEVIESLKNSGVCEYHLHDERGKIIITIEGDNVGEEIEKLKIVQKLPHVLAADMMYSYTEDELDRERAKLEFQDSVPAWLNDESVAAEDIKYKGDLRN